MSNAEIRAGYIDIMDRMVQAGWLHSHIFTEGKGKGFHLVWTPQGTEKAITLRKIITSFHIADSDAAAMQFTVLAELKGLDVLVRPGTEGTDGLAEFWCQCLKDLGLERGGDRLQFFVHVIEGWGPTL